MLSDTSHDHRGKVLWYQEGEHYGCRMEWQDAHQDEIRRKAYNQFTCVHHRTTYCSPFSTTVLRTQWSRKISLKNEDESLFSFSGCSSIENLGSPFFKGLRLLIFDCAHSIHFEISISESAAWS